jgi:hypothetical protein
MTHVSSPSILSPFHNVILFTAPSPPAFSATPRVPAPPSLGSHVPKVVLQAKPTILPPRSSRPRHSSQTLARTPRTTPSPAVVAGPRARARKWPEWGPRAAGRRERPRGRFGTIPGSTDI